jgi:hypothetical protein
MVAHYETHSHDYLHAHTTAEKVLCIDQLVHSFHISLRTCLDRLFTKTDGVDKEQ